LALNLTQKALSRGSICIASSKETAKPINYTRQPLPLARTNYLVFFNMPRPIL